MVIIRILPETHIVDSYMMSLKLWISEMGCGFCGTFYALMITWLHPLLIKQAIWNARDYKNEVIIKTTLIHINLLKINIKFQFFEYSYWSEKITNILVILSPPMMTYQWVINYTME